MDLQAGSRYRSAVGEAEVVVVKAPDGPTDLRSGGRPMVAFDAPAPEPTEPAAGFDEPILLGKRYTDGTGGLEVLCTKGGPGALSVGDEALAVKGAKPLPSSD